tara:strand:+ start:139 stop:306 length:168 start_codon:yes stop_codon:yes gene_type:complete
MKTKPVLQDMSNEDLLKLQEEELLLIQNSQSILNQIAIVIQKRLDEPALLKTYDF